MLRRFYFDSLVFGPQALRFLMDLVGADHACMGTNAPFEMGDDHPQETIAPVPGLTKQEQHDACCGTALRLLGEGASSLN